uniref:Uncharacterized protein n=1 Tax=Arundo donax TaxID=35708 RepID=A0A0A9GKI9_ARUDO
MSEVIDQCVIRCLPHFKTMVSKDCIQCIVR